MKTLFVTGGAGFIGSAVVRRALGQGYRVVTLDALTYAGSRENLNDISNKNRHEFIEVNICDKRSLELIFEEFKPHAVIHLAAETHVDNSIANPGAFLKTNIVGTFNLLEVTRSYLSCCSAGVNFKFIHVSTDEVYGSLGQSELFHETSPYMPSSPYSASKASSDHLVSAWHKTFGLPVIITNCTNNFGPRQFPEKLVPLTIKNALKSKPICLFGNGNNIRDWLYVYDHADALLTVLNKGNVGHRYNIGAQNEMTNNELVKLICLSLSKIHSPGKNFLELITYVEDRPGHDFRYALNSNKIRKELGWRPSFSFKAALEDTIRWYLSDGSHLFRL